MKNTQFLNGEEMSKILKKIGYDIRKEKVSYWVSCYHNSQTKEETEAYFVYDKKGKSGKRVKPYVTIQYIEEYDHVIAVFNSLFTDLLIKLLKNEKESNNKKNNKTVRKVKNN